MSVPYEIESKFVTFVPFVSPLLSLIIRTSNSYFLYSNEFKYCLNDKIIDSHESGIYLYNFNFQ